jgi:hypothetical protein
VAEKDLLLPKIVQHPLLLSDKVRSGQVCLLRGASGEEETNSPSPLPLPFRERR